MDELKENLAKAKALPANTQDEKELRKFSVEIAKKQIASKKHITNISETLKNLLGRIWMLFSNCLMREDDYNSKLPNWLREKKLPARLGAFPLSQIAMLSLKSLKSSVRPFVSHLKSLQMSLLNSIVLPRPIQMQESYLLSRKTFKHFDEIAALYGEAKANAEEKTALSLEKITQSVLKKRQSLKKKKQAKAPKKANKKDK